MGFLDELKKGGRAAQDSGEQSAQVLQGPTPKGIVKESYNAVAVVETNEEQVRDKQPEVFYIYGKKWCLQPRFDLWVDIVFEGRYEVLTMLFTQYQIRVRGRNLQRLILARADRSLIALTEFDDLIHQPVTDPNATVIESLHHSVFNPEE